jgi:hypothetical protein
MERIAAWLPVAVFEILSPIDTPMRIGMARRGLCAQMGIQTFLVIDADGTKYRFIVRRLEPLEARAFDKPGSHCDLDLDEIEKPPD